MMEITVPMCVEQLAHPEHNILPIYTTVENAAAALKRGGVAFQTETTGIYPEIAKRFDPPEICELRSVIGLLEHELMVMVQPKKSMYTEQFRITMMQITEGGLVARELKIHRKGKPICQSSSTIHPVTFVNARIIFQIFYGGAFTSFLMFLIEMVTMKWYHHRV